MPEVPEGVKLDFGSPQFIDYERIGGLQRLADPSLQTAARPNRACSLIIVLFWKTSCCIPPISAGLPLLMHPVGSQV